MKDEPVMSILSGIVMAAEAVVGSQSRFYDDVQADHHKPPVFTMLDRPTDPHMTWLMTDISQALALTMDCIVSPHPSVCVPLSQLSQKWNIAAGPRCGVVVWCVVTVSWSGTTHTNTAPTSCHLGNI